MPSPPERAFVFLYSAIFVCSYYEI
jgi:hypothetical protein